MTFPVPLYIHTRKDTGKEILVRKPEWFDKRLAEMIADIEAQAKFATQAAEASGGDAPDPDKVKDIQIEQVTKEIEKRKAKHEALLDDKDTKLIEFELAKPTYGELSRCREAAKITDKDGRGVSVDNVKLLDGLLNIPGVVLRDGEPVKVSEMTCQGAIEELRVRLWESIVSDDSDVPNASTP